MILLKSIFFGSAIVDSYFIIFSPGLKHVETTSQSWLGVRNWYFKSTKKPWKPFPIWPEINITNHHGRLVMLGLLDELTIITMGHFMKWIIRSLNVQIFHDCPHFPTCSCQALRHGKEIRKLRVVQQAVRHHEVGRPTFAALQLLDILRQGGRQSFSRSRPGGVNILELWGAIMGRYETNSMQ